MKRNPEKPQRKEAEETNTLRVEDTDSNISERDANALENMSAPEVAEEWACALPSSFEAKLNPQGSKRTYDQAREHVRALRKKRFGPSPNKVQL